MDATQETAHRLVELKTGRQRGEFTDDDWEWAVFLTGAMEHVVTMTVEEFKRVVR